MPWLSVKISEQMEAKIVDLIIEGKDFSIDGGTLNVGPVQQRLREIVFHFVPTLAEIRPEPKKG